MSLIEFCTLGQNFMKTIVDVLQLSKIFFEKDRAHFSDSSSLDSQRVNINDNSAITKP